MVHTEHRAAASGDDRDDVRRAGRHRASISLRLLPLEEFPDVTFPGMQVIIPYPGSTPEEIEQLITRPGRGSAVDARGHRGAALALGGRPGDASRSRFDWGRDIDAAAFEVRTKLDAIRSRAAEPAPIACWTFSLQRVRSADRRRCASPPTRTSPTSTTLLERYLKRPIERVPGVARVELQGVVPREVAS